MKEKSGSPRRKSRSSRRKGIKPFSSTDKLYIKHNSKKNFGLGTAGTFDSVSKKKAWDLPPNYNIKIASSKQNININTDNGLVIIKQP